MLKAKPEKSNRQIAKQTKVSQDGRCRPSGDRGTWKIPHVEKRTDTKGRAQPTKKALLAEKRARAAERSVSLVQWNEMTLEQRSAGAYGTNRQALLQSSGQR